MPIATLALVSVLGGIDTPQGGGTAQGTVQWPPTNGVVRHYDIQASKARAVGAAASKTERAARKEAGLYAPARPPNQSVALKLTATLTGGEDAVQVKYTSQVEKWRGRIALVKPKVSAASTPVFENAQLAAFWGHPDKRGGKGGSVPRSAVERGFEQTFRRRGNRTEPASFVGRFGDHLLPVLWDYSLPCWAEQLLVVMDLEDQGDIIGGKTLIQDRSESAALGQRETRVELAFEKVSAKAFTMKYKMRVDQLVGVDRAGGGARKHPFNWRFEIVGVARYNLADQAFESVTEKIVAHPRKPDQHLFADLRDQFFTGEIHINRVVPKAKRRRR